MISTLCDDLLKIIIGELDECDVATFSHTCWRLYKLVHEVWRWVTLTDNVFEAVRIGSIISFKSACITIDELPPIIGMRNVDARMLTYIYEKFYQRTYNDEIVYRLCKLGVFTYCTTEILSSNARSLVIHAIKYNKCHLLSHMKSILDDDAFHQYCACGYAKIGDYENFILHYMGYRSIDRLDYYAHVGGNKDIIDMFRSDDCAHDDALFAHHPDKALGIGYAIVCIRHIVKRDNYVLFNHAINHSYGPIIVELCIKYNAINIISRCVDNKSIFDYASLPTSGINVVDMTMKMAKLLLRLTDNDESVVDLIVHSYNYRLTEMLRAKGLYKHEHTRMSIHYSF